MGWEKERISQVNKKELLERIEVKISSVASQEVMWSENIWRQEHSGQKISSNTTKSLSHRVSDKYKVTIWTCFWAVGFMTKNRFQTDLVQETLLCLHQSMTSLQSIGTRDRETHKDKPGAKHQLKGNVEKKKKKFSQSPKCQFFLNFLLSLIMTWHKHWHTRRTDDQLTSRLNFRKTDKCKKTKGKPHRSWSYRSARKKCSAFKSSAWTLS